MKSSNVAKEVDAQPWVELLCNWFGFDPEIFSPFRMIQANPKHIHLISKDHIIPTQPLPLSSGLVLIRINMRYPKMTTSAAMLFGQHATKHVVVLNEAQIDLYLKRQTQILDASLITQCDGSGYVMIQHAGQTLGLGLLRRKEDEVSGTLESLYPKSQILRDGRSAFG